MDSSLNQVNVTHTIQLLKTTLKKIKEKKLPHPDITTSTLGKLLKAQTFWVSSSTYRNSMVWNVGQDSFKNKLLFRGFRMYR